jgi:hypothetical protein
MVTNEGDVSKNIDWTIKILGGSIPGFHVDREFTGEDIHLEPEESASFGTGMFFGLGQIDVEVTVEASGDPPLIKEVDGFLFFFYVFV